MWKRISDGNQLLHAVGIEDVVASWVTAFSIEQVRLAMRYSDSKQLILIFDANISRNYRRQRAIGEVADLAYKGEVQLKIVNIPDGKDADEYLFNHRQKVLQQLFTNAPMARLAKWNKYLRDCDLNRVTDSKSMSANGQVTKKYS